ncbi:amino acid ABC transporter permease [Variovorax sp. Sphag1AA]|uniref:amino acid ABC transporter permease n=1 Tax=Variovorax sp. Sphag1AA TaxID=2587027 RepID=UPI00162111BF|nr:amino acid ABC transporter permease [Variovorax sp. Sphag1AA]MBB3178191.1 general L-amino acid transport system permease protein [Variovorax sp. Sphag1AA]
MTHYVATTRIEASPPPMARRFWLHQLRSDFFATPATGATTLVLALLLLALGWKLLDWGVLHAVFNTHGQGPDACRVAGAGACWAVINEKFRLIVFGIYPYAQQWRAALGMAILVAMYMLSTRRSWWNRRLAIAWVVALAAFGALMWGGVMGLPFVPDDQWGGLPVTLILATLGLAAGFPLAVALALLRHSSRPGVGKALAVAYIEIARSVPLLAVLFLASVMIPLFLPQGMDLSKLLRVFLAFALFTAAYLAEVIRGGLQVVPRGQYEAAAALGLSPRVTTLRVVLPQALTAVLPALVNVFIAFFKATSIVVIVGIFDLMTAAKRAIADAQWQGFGTEIYLFVAAIYFIFCFAMSRYSARLHASLDVGRRG